MVEQRSGASRPVPGCSDCQGSCYGPLGKSPVPFAGLLLMTAVLGYTMLGVFWAFRFPLVALYGVLSWIY